jgi:tetraacyldisaccharide 4'-kinase
LRIKSYFEDLLYGRKRSLLIGAVLSVLSLLYRSIIRLRQTLYQYGLLRSEKPACKVISVGNITLGGTGKTPMVIALAGLLSQKQKRPAVISRGYGRKDDSAVLIVSDGSSVLVDTLTGGDEPVLIGSKLSGVPVVVGKNRREASQFAVQRFGADLVILDDGFQHLKLKRDVDIVLIDAADPFGNGKLFPSGILREPVVSLRRAHAVVLTRADAADAVESLRERIRQVTAAPVFTSHERAADLIDTSTRDVKPLSVLRGTRMLAFSGIARPLSFAALLRSLGGVIAAECVYPDHHEYSKTDLAAIFQKAADERVSLIVTTEKDAVRLKGFNAGGIWALRIELSIVERQEWEAFLLNNV